MEPAEGLPESVRDKLLVPSLYFIKKTTTKKVMVLWSRRRDSNPRPADYKSAALAN